MGKSLCPFAWPISSSYTCHPRTPPIDPQAAVDAEGKCLAANAAALRSVTGALGQDGKARIQPPTSPDRAGTAATATGWLLLLEHRGLVGQLRAMCGETAEGGDGSGGYCIGASQQGAGTVGGAQQPCGIGAHCPAAGLRMECALAADMSYG